MIKGSAFQAIKQTVLTLLGFGIVVAVGLMGAAWSGFLILSVILALPVLLVYLPLVLWTNRFSLDDEKRRLSKPGSGGMAYDKVKRVMITRRGRFFDIVVSAGPFRGMVLVQSADEQLLAELEPVLRERLPQAVFTAKRPLLPWSIIVSLLLAALVLGIAQAFMIKTSPNLAHQPNAVNWLQDKDLPESLNREYLGEFGFAPPKGCVYAGEEKDTLYFEDRKKHLRIKAMTGTAPLPGEYQKLLFRYAMEVRSRADLLRLVYGARFGVVPRFLKTRELAGLEDPALFVAGGPEMTIYIVQARLNNEEIVRIIAAGRRWEQEIRFFITSPARLPEETLRRFVGSIQPIGR
ncbi:MAG: hypothetical protein M0042_02710 [Nitrospiraceae bacterium]|nr:hypothetical protein [Nitrospiraceae bacterium]